MLAENTDGYDYSQVHTTARVALYDDFASTPRITKIDPAETAQFIENLTVAIYEQSKLAGGKIPYSVIREVTENFIHAQFREIVVSILDEGNTIRFADQGPGISEKEKAQEPGFSSAIEPMKDYIRGVGSGFPLVRDYLDGRAGSIQIEDNLTTGAVITISLTQKQNQTANTRNEAINNKDAASAAKPEKVKIPRIPLTEREREFIKLFLKEGDLGVTEIKDFTGYAPSTVHSTLTKIEEAGLIQFTIGKKRGLTELGQLVAESL